MSLECGFFDSTEIVEEVGGGYPRGDKAQDAEFFAGFFSDIIGDGVLPSPSSAFQVLPQSGMQVQLRPGKCYIKGYMAWDTEAAALTVTAGTTVYAVFRLNTDSGEITRLLSESIQRSGSVYDLAVARITAPAGTVEVTDAMIEDLRSDPDYCGYVQKITDEAAEELWAALTPKIDRGQLLDLVYPVGSIYIAYHHTSPAELFGGTWTRMQDCFLWACAASESIGETGGEKTHVLTVNEMPSHRHDVAYAGTSGNSYGFADSTSASSSGMKRTSYTGGGAAHNNMPPYVSVAVWRRTA